ncbi:MAG: CU044_5270 family protein [Propionibacteriaceae bacterium]|jgi:hypothetical protein|nr:CU044_5270 family protein [Propionibacteriaceae bacterium]
MAEAQDSSPTAGDFTELERDTRELLGAIGGSAPKTDLSQDERRRVNTTAQRALTGILDGAPQRQSQRLARLGPPRPRRRALAVACAAVVVVSGGAVAVLAPWQEDAGTTTLRTPALAQFEFSARDSGGAAAAALHQLAAAAAAQPPSGDGPIQLVIAEKWSLPARESQGTAQLGPLTAVRAEHYLLDDGAWRVIERRGQPVDDKGQIANWTAAATAPATSDQTLPGPSEGPDYPTRLPTDPEALAARLAAEKPTCAQPAYCLGEALIRLHQTYVLEPRLTAALWSAAADMAEVVYLGQTRDRLGRAAVAIQTPGADAGRVNVIYADPVSGAFLGSEEVVTADDHALGLPAPAVVSFTAIVASERVAADKVP